MPTGTETPAAPASARWPLVGRREQLDEITDAHASGEIRAVLVHGPAGVGKSRLADEAFELITSAGHVGGRVSGSVGAARVALGALIPLLPVEVLERELEPLALYSTVAATFRARVGSDAPFVLLVDDMHRLDIASLTLLGQLLDNDIVFLIGTIRSGEPGSQSVMELWRRDRVLRIDLTDLAIEDVDTLLYLTLGGAVDASTLDAIYSASRGNVLFVRELVVAARTSGRLAERRGVWRLTGTLPNSARLTELVDARIASVPDDASDLLVRLALWEPVGLRELEAVGGATAVEALDAAGLLQIRLDGRRHEVSLTHPLYGEVVREQVTPLVRRRHLVQHADRTVAYGARRREDPLRVANARLEANGTADPALLLTAARLARYGHDHQRVERLARASLEVQVTPEAALLLAEACHELAMYEEAETVLVETEDALGSADERQAVLLVSMRVRNLFWGLHRPYEALTVNRAARETFTVADAVDELIADEAMLLACSGRPLEALDVLVAQPGSSPRAAVLRDISEEVALLLAGRCEAALQLAKSGYAQHQALGDQVAIAHPGIHVIHQMLALLDAGRIGAATRLSSAAYGIATGVGAPAGRIWWAYGLGRAGLLGGKMRTGRRWLAEASGMCLDAGFHIQHRLVLSLLAVCDATLGDVDAAQAAVDELDSLPFTDFRASEHVLGRAWTAAARGDAQRARELLMTEAELAGTTGNFALEAWLLHDVVRLGDAAAVAERLTALERICEGPLVEAYATHAHGAAAGAAATLRDAAERFERMGALLLAAEAATAASDGYKRNGEPREATTMAAHAAALAAQCEGAHTPGLATTDALVPLTARELEIGSLAADRLTSKEIADRLYLSARTVDNHLQKIYTKLGVSSRAELADALTRRPPLPPSSSPP